MTGIRIDPHMIRRVTNYDGALLEEAHPGIHEVIPPEVAHTMTRDAGRGGAIRHRYCG